MSATISPHQLRAALILLAGLGIAALGNPPAARAADYGAKTNGIWSSSTTWTPAGVPSFNDDVYIGSTYPNGAAATATVLLTQNQQANTVVLGYGAGTSGTLNLGNFNLTANALYLGFNGGTGAITRGTGSLNIGYLQLSSSNLVLNANDRTTHLFLTNGSSAHTASTANVSDGVRVWSGSTLTLGADLYSGGFWDSYNIEVSGANSTLDAQFHKITTNDLSIGWEFNGVRSPGNNVVHFLNRGALDVGNLFVANQGLDLTATDKVNGFILSKGNTHLGTSVAIESLYLSNGATATTAAAGNITYHVSVESGSTLTLGANLNVGIEGGSGRYVTVMGNNSILDAQGHSITATGLIIGWGETSSAQLLNRGDLVLNELLVGNQNFNLTATDQVPNFSLSNASTTFVPAAAVQNLYLQDGATAATSAVANITSGVTVTSGSTLTLGANLNVSGSVQVSGDNSTLNAQFHKITADTLSLVWDGGTNVQLLNRGGLAVTNLLVANQNFDLTAADQVTNFSLSNGSSNLGAGAVVTNFSLYNATSNLGAAAVVQDLYLQNASATTAATGNLTRSVEVTSGSMLTLGADLGVSGSVDVSGSSTLNAQGHKITADTLSINGGGGNALLNKGELAVTNLYVINQNQNLALGAADRVANLNLGGSTASTAAIGNVTGSVQVIGGSTFTLGADLTVAGAINVDGFYSDTLNAQGHKITADMLTLGYSGTNARLLNRGELAVTNLQVANQDFNLAATDQVASFYLSYGKTTLGAGVRVQSLAVYDDAMATTSATGNITTSVDIANVGNTTIGSKLTLGADLNLSGHVNALGNTITINAQGHNITAGSLSLKYDAFGNPGSPIQLLNDGAITITGALALAGGAQVDLHGGNDRAGGLFLSENSGLRIKSAATGFSLTGATADDLLFNGTSTLTLELNGLQPGWVLRWANPAGGNHIADLNALIAQDFIVFDVTNGGQYNIVSQNGYTYIVQPVPEPGLILLMGAPAIGLYLRRRNHSATHAMAA